MLNNVLAAKYWYYRATRETDSVKAEEAMLFSWHYLFVAAECGELPLDRIYHDARK